MHAIIRIAVSILILGSVAANAQSFPKAHDWSGVYGGISLGYSSSLGTFASDVGAGTYFCCNDAILVSALGTGSADVGSVVGGAHVGRNWQNEDVVYGIEAELLSMGDGGIERSVSGDYINTLGAPLDYTLDQSANAQWIASVRPRLGIAKGRFLTYVSGGVAVADIDSSLTFESPAFNFPSRTMRTSEPRFGLALGAGVQTVLSDSWSMRVEYMHYDFGSVTFSETLAVPCCTAPFTQSVDLRSNTVKFMLTYAFARK